jgi:hypothetical protein
MQFFPRDRDGLASLQVLYAAGYFFVPSRLNGLLRFFETVEQGVGQCRALINRERECPLQEIGNFWAHDVILPVDFGCKYLFPGMRGTAFSVPFDALILKRSLIPPPPWVSWNHWISGKFLAKSGA